MSLDYYLKSDDTLTALVRSQGIDTWHQLTSFIQNLPYGRNSNRTDFGLVISEMKGTCSSKHALLKSIADLNQVPDIQLVIGIYRMTQLNTPGIGSALGDNTMTYIPEAHCYLKIKGERTDLTSTQSEFEKIEKYIIEEMTILPEQVATFKVTYHKNFIQKWLQDNDSKLDLEEIWRIRETCIMNLST